VYVPRVNYGRFVLVAGLLLLSCGGPATLPDYASPKSTMAQRSDVDLSDVVGYGPLRREDFKGLKAPFASEEDSKKLGAQVFAILLPPRELEILERWTKPASGKATYEAKLKDAPHYTAVMSRNRSWWNPKSTNPVDYQLQHEQIHFALAEISARKLNAAAPENLKKIHATGSSAEAVQGDVKEQVNQLLRDETAKLVERNRQFDLDTSLGFNPQKQAEWLRIAESELEALEEHAVPYVPSEAAPP
jgi:hypothetical protein